MESFSDSDTNSSDNDYELIDLEQRDNASNAPPTLAPSDTPSRDEQDVEEEQSKMEDGRGMEETAAVTPPALVVAESAQEIKKQQPQDDGERLRQAVENRFAQIISERDAQYGRYEDEIAFREAEIGEFQKAARKHGKMIEQLEREVGIYRQLYDDESALKEATIEKLIQVTEEKEKNEEMVATLEKDVAMYCDMYEDEATLRQETSKKLLEAREEEAKNEEIFEQLKKEVVSYRQQYEVAALKQATAKRLLEVTDEKEGEEIIKELSTQIDALRNPCTEKISSSEVIQTELQATEEKEKHDEIVAKLEKEVEMYRCMYEDEIALRQETLKNLHHVRDEQEKNEEIIKELSIHINMLMNQREKEISSRQEIQTELQATEEKEKHDEILAKLEKEVAMYRGMYEDETALREDMFRQLLQVKHEKKKNEEIVEGFAAQLQIVRDLREEEIVSRQETVAELSRVKAEKQKDLQTIAQLEEKLSCTIHDELTNTSKKEVRTGDTEGTEKMKDTTEEKRDKFKNNLIQKKQKIEKQIMNQNWVFVALFCDIVTLIMSIMIAYFGSSVEPGSSLAIFLGFCRMCHRFEMLLCSLAAAWFAVKGGATSGGFSYGILIGINVHLLLFTFPIDIYIIALFAKSMLALCSALVMRIDLEETFGLDDIADVTKTVVKETHTVVFSKNTSGSTGFGLDDVIVTSVDANSDAEKKGLMRGDEIILINGFSVDGVSGDVLTTVLAGIVGPITLKVRRAVGAQNS